MLIYNCTSKNQAKAYIEIYKILKLNNFNIEEAERLLNSCKNNLRMSVSTSQLHIPELNDIVCNNTNSDKEIVLME